MKDKYFAVDICGFCHRGLLLTFLSLQEPIFVVQGRLTLHFLVTGPGLESEAWSEGNTVPQAMVVCQGVDM
jgi:hypothetical protein